MNTREIAEEYRLSHWSEIMRQRQESGLSIKEYCKTADIHQNVYYYWQRKLREAACQQLLPTAQRNAETAVAPSGWTVCRPAKTESQTAVVIEIGKCRITADADTNQETLTKVCRVLMSLC